MTRPPEEPPWSSPLRDPIPVVGNRDLIRVCSIDTIWPVLVSTAFVGAESHAYPHGNRSGWDVPMCSAIVHSASSRS